MSNKPKFSGTVLTVPDVQEEPLEALKRVGATLNRSIKLTGQVHPLAKDTNFYNRLLMEVHFCLRGSPYYKVWPGVLEALYDINIDINGKFLENGPYPVWEIKLPINSFLASKAGPSILVHITDLQEPIPNEYPSKGMQLVAERNYKSAVERYGKKAKRVEASYITPGDLKSRMFSSSYIVVSEDNTIMSALDDPNRPIIEDMSESDIKMLYSVVTGVTLFAINNHELVMPDVKQEIIHLPRGKKRKKATLQMKKPVKTNKWKIGSEVDLPRPVVIRSPGSGSDSSPTGDELNFGHMRSGFMRMQPCGKHNQDRKLIFVAPTVVRPDLPLRASSGYRLRDRILPRPKGASKKAR